MPGRHHPKLPLPDVMTVAEFHRRFACDAACLDICQVTAYYAFVNRLADGLGVELKDFWDE